jgi:hypothetical protein
MSDKSQKSLKSRKSNRRFKQIDSINRQQTAEEKRKSRRSLTILGFFIILTFCIAGLANWRSSSFSGQAGSNLKAPSAATVMSTPPPLPSNQPSKEYIYSGNALLATSERSRGAVPDDFAVWRPGDGTWYILGSQQQYITYQFGSGNDTPAPGDFDGDSKTDFCVYRSSEQTWYILNSSDGAVQYVNFGNASDKPVVADYDGDGKADIAVYRSSNLTWYIRKSSDSSIMSGAFGNSGDFPVPADYDGDGKADVAIWRDGAAQFWLTRSSDGQVGSISFGQTGDQPVIGDYDGDGKADFATRRSDNIWRILNSSNLSTQAVAWGAVPIRQFRAITITTGRRTLRSGDPPAACGMSAKARISPNGRFNGDLTAIIRFRHLTVAADKNQE